jgi:1-phosphofructokinase
MITTVTLNPAIDKTLSLEKFEYGKVNRVKSLREDIGGKGINVAKILKNLGQDVSAIGFIGEKNKEYVDKLLAKTKIDTEFVVVDAATRTNTKIVDLEKGETTDINEAGFCVDKSQISDMIDLVKKYAEKSSYTIFSGSAPNGVGKKTYFDIVQGAATTSKIIIDAEGEFLTESLKLKPYLIKPNITELEEALSKKMTNDSEIIEASRELIMRYQITYILVSMGGEGSILISKEKALKAMPVKVKVKSTVGAGDSMLAGFVSGLLINEKNLVTALKYGAACGTLAVEKEGTEAFSKEEIENMVPRIIVKEI